jgi:hypothetical protein
LGSYCVKKYGILVGGTVVNIAKKMFYLPFFMEQ